MRLREISKVSIERLLVPFHWLFVRLPRPFTLPLVVFLLLYFFLLFPALVSGLGYVLVSFLALVARNNPLSNQAGIWPTILTIVGGIVLLDINLIASALITLALAIGGILLSHWLAGTFYKIYRRFRAKVFTPHVPFGPLSNHTADDTDNPLAKYKRIGIILSGGGAKGAYQAGAMRAIYEFLEEHDAHKNVQMIAATSIGSWNALFWLADLIKSPNGGPGPLEDWWRRVNVQDIILPIRYVPTRQNYLLSNQPWRDNFDAVFRGTAAPAHRGKYRCRNRVAALVVKEIVSAA